MKKFVIALSLVLASAFGASAQEWVGVNRDENGNIVRGAYLTNEWFDNWYIGVAGGVSTRYTIGNVNDPIVHSYISPVAEITLTKWFTPCVGARFGWQGLNGKEGLNGYNPYQIGHSAFPYSTNVGVETPGDLSYGFNYLHGDILWDIANTFWGYKYKRIWDPNVYAHAGYVHLYNNEEGLFTDKRDREFGLGIGMYNTFHLTERLAATLDIRQMAHASRYRAFVGGQPTWVTTATVGLAYNIYRTYWNRAQTIVATGLAARAAADAAETALAQSNDEAAALRRQLAAKDAVIAQLNDELAKKGIDDSKTVEEVPYKTLQERAANADLVVYYYINKEVLNFSELHHLDNYVQGVLAKDPNHVFYLTGSADKGTGTLERNTYLSSARANNVKNILMKDFGVKEENIVIKATVISDKHLDGALDRCVLIEKE